MSTQAIIYTKTTCPYCVAAKDLLIGKGIGYEERNVEHDAGHHAAWKALGRETVPQIILLKGSGPEHVGGADDLYELASRRQL